MRCDEFLALIERLVPRLTPARVGAEPGGVVGVA